MIRHKATGTELKWRPTLDPWGSDGQAWVLASEDNNLTPVYVYPPHASMSNVYSFNSLSSALWRSDEPQTKESMLAKAVELGVVEIVEDAVHRADEIDQAIDEHNRLLEDARALAIRLFLAGHDDAASALRRLL